ncbi:MAG: lipid droplet-associated protein [Antricoccus sp.]
MPGPSLPAPLSALLSIDLPDPFKAVAGLALQTAEDVRQLPARLTGLPMTVVSTLMQRSMNLQQQYAELVTKGEQFIGTLRAAPSSQPEWATFDEDNAAPSPTPITVADPSDTISLTAATTSAATTPSPAKSPARKRPRSSPTAALIAPSAGLGPGSSFDQILDEPAPKASSPTSAVPDPNAPKSPVAHFDQLSIPQLRARLRSFDADTVAALIEYETTAANRPPVLVMLRSRLTALRPKQ